MRRIEQLLEHTGGGDLTTTFTHDPLTAGPHAVASMTTASGTTRFAYDPVGNMTSSFDGTITESLTWDARNRLVSWSDGSDTYSFTYDHSGERVTRSDGTTTVIYLGDVEVEGSTARTYYGFAGSVVGVRTTSGSSTTLEVVISDHLGSPHVTYDPATSTVTGTRLHRPYGEPRYESGALPGDRGYTGQQADPTGLMYYGARYYSPGLMSFVSADTIVPDPSHSGDLNRYGYVRGNPVNYNDPSGNVLDLAIRTITEWWGSSKGLTYWDERTRWVVPPPSRPSTDTVFVSAVETIAGSATAASEKLGIRVGGFIVGSTTDFSRAADAFAEGDLDGGFYYLLRGIVRGGGGAVGGGLGCVITVTEGCGTGAVFGAAAGSEVAERTYDWAVDRFLRMRSGGSRQGDYTSQGDIGQFTLVGGGGVVFSK